MMSQRTSQLLSDDGRGHPVQIPSLCGIDHDVRNVDDQGGSTSGSGSGRSSSTTATPSALGGASSWVPAGYVVFFYFIFCYSQTLFNNCEKSVWTLKKL